MVCTWVSVENYFWVVGLVKLPICTWKIHSKSNSNDLNALNPEICKYICAGFFITKFEQRLQLRATHFSCIRRARHSLAPPTQFHSFARSPLLVACGMPNVLCGCILIEIFLYLHTLTVLYRNCYSTLIYILFYTYVCVCVAACVYHVADISAAIVLFAVDELHFAHVHPLPFAFDAASAAPRRLLTELVQSPTKNTKRSAPNSISMRP